MLNRAFATKLPTIAIDVTPSDPPLSNFDMSTFVHVVPPLVERDTIELPSEPSDACSCAVIQSSLAVGANMCHRMNDGMFGIFVFVHECAPAARR